jgi:hypothetical protein
MEKIGMLKCYYQRNPNRALGLCMDGYMVGTHVRHRFLLHEVGFPFIAVADLCVKNVNAT